MDGFTEKRGSAAPGSQAEMTRTSPPHSASVPASRVESSWNPAADNRDWTWSTVWERDCPESYTTSKMGSDWALTTETQSMAPTFHAYQAPTVKGVQLSHPELLEVNLIDYDFQWAGEHKKEFVDKFTNEISAADSLKE